MAQVRIGHSLSDGEKNYISGRKYSVQRCLVKNNIHCSLVPNIAILGSGGGQRAMVGMLGSLSQMGEQGLLDTALYVSGVSGSTWCMASLYEKTNWSSDLKQIKIVAERLGNDSVSLKDRVFHLMKYYHTNDNFSLTDAWAALVVPDFVKKIDGSTLSNYQTGPDKDPYPIFTVINQDSKYKRLLRESFFELTPHEAGYTLAGAFVGTSSFGSIFNEGVLTKKKPEMDMTYLQGVCGSALADKEVILQKLKEWLEKWESKEKSKNQRGFWLLSTMVDLQLWQYTGGDPTDLLQNANKLLEGKVGLDGLPILFNFVGKKSKDKKEQIHTITSAICQLFFVWNKDLVGRSEELVVFVKTLDKVNEKPPDKPVEGPSNPYNEEPLKQLIDSVKRAAVALQDHDGPRVINCMLKLNHLILRGEDGTPLVDELNGLLKGKTTVSGRHVRINKDEWVEADLKARRKLALGLSLDICESFFSWFQDLKNWIWDKIVRKILAFVKSLLDLFWNWGTNYNYLHNMNAPHVDPQLLKSKTSNFEDAGLLVNSPYMSALRAEREIDLIISFDFSEGNPMETLTQTAQECEELGIPFPAIHYPDDDAASPKSFYVFKGVEKAPTVIHMPLFNVENCGSELEHYRKKYQTFQGAYSAQMIEELMEKAGENVINNKEKLLREIASIVK